MVRCALDRITAYLNPFTDTAMDLRISSSTAPLSGAGLARRAATPQAEGNEVGFSSALKGAHSR